MLSPHHPIGQKKNVKYSRYGQELISELYQQEIAFKSFVSSLSKCHNRYISQQLNPQQNTRKKVSSSFMMSTREESMQTPEKNLLKQKKQLIQKIKNSEDTPLVNFRITKSKINQKFTTTSPYQSRTSRVYKSSIKADSKNHSNFQQFSCSPGRINQTVNLFYNSLQRQSPKLNQINTKSTSFGQTVRKLSLQKTNCISWNPNSKQFISSLFSSSQSLQSNFLLSLLNINVENTINFLFQQTNAISRFNQVEAKNICNFFDTILQINQVKPLQEPLIKKYSNCIFYGQKPNFISAHAGIIIYFNGNSYFGSLFNFQKHGIGIELVRPQRLKEKRIKKIQNGTVQNFIIYQGNFERNSKTGSFRVNAPDCIYQGSLSNGLFEGQGTLLTSKSTFKGKWEKNKKLEGQQIFSKEQMTYEGAYFEDKFHGFGKLRKSNEFYEGQFSNGLKNGKGVLVNQDFIFGGSFKHGLKHGAGTYFDKSQYKQKNKDIKEQNYDFNQCIYSVQFNENKMISKVEMKARSFSKESLQTFEDAKSDRQTLILDFQNIRPSKLLEKGCTDKLYEKQQKVRETFQNFQRYKKTLTVIPSEPEQQVLFNNRVTSYLYGNHNYRSPKKLAKDCS